MKKLDHLFENVPEVLRKYYPGGFFGDDCDGRLVFIQPLGQIDFKGLLHSVKIEELLNYKRLQSNYAMKELKEREEHLGKSLGNCTTLVLDFEGLTVAQMWLPGFKSYQKIIDLLEKEYPQGCERVIMINVPSFFQSAFQVIRMFLGKKSKEKVKVLGADWKVTLQNYITPDNLPMHYGGNLKDENADPKCQQFICYGGTVPESYYVTKNTNTENFEHIKIKKGKSFQVLKVTTASNDCIEYNFMTIDKDIGFKVEFAKDSENMTLVEYSRISCQYIMETGVIPCDKPGTYIFTFDNKYSWLHAKELCYSICIKS